MKLFEVHSEWCPELCVFGLTADEVIDAFGHDERVTEMALRELSGDDSLEFSGGTIRIDNREYKGVGNERY